MNNKSLEKEIDLQINIKNNLWNAFIVSTGGTLGLLINPDSIIKKALIAVGFVIILVLINGYIKRNDYTDKLLDKLKQKD